MKFKKGEKYALFYESAFARSKKSSSEMNGTKSSLPYAFGVSLEKTRNVLPQV